MEKASSNSSSQDERLNQDTESAASDFSYCTTASINI